MEVDRIDERGKKMALRGKRKRKQAKRGARLTQEIQTRGTGQRSRRYGHKNKEGENTQNPGTKQTATNAERGGGSDNHKKNVQKTVLQQWHIQKPFNNSPVRVESQHTRIRVGARSVSQERKERKKKTRRARKKERKRKEKKKEKRA